MKGKTRLSIFLNTYIIVAIFKRSLISCKLHSLKIQQSKNNKDAKI